MVHEVNLYYDDSAPAFALAEARAPYPANHGSSWAAVDLYRLKSMFRDGKPITEIAVELGRRNNAVALKLHSLRLLRRVQEPGTLQYNYRYYKAGATTPTNEDLPTSEKEDETMIEDCKPSKPTCDADTTPVYEDRTYVLGTNINACSEDSLLTLLSRLKDRVRRLEGLPDGPYHAKRTADLKKAEQAVLNQLNTRF